MTILDVFLLIVVIITVRVVTAVPEANDHIAHASVFFDSNERTHLAAVVGNYFIYARCGLINFRHYFCTCGYSNS